MGAGASLDSLDYTPLNTILQLNHRVVWKNYQGWLERNYSRNYFLLKMIMYCANKEFILQAMDKLYIQYSGAPQPDMGSIFQIKNPWNILIIGNSHVIYQNDQSYQNELLLFSSDTRGTINMHLFLFTNRAQRELVSYVRREFATFCALLPCAAQALTFVYSFQKLQ